MAARRRVGSGESGSSLGGAGTSGAKPAAKHLIERYAHADEKRANNPPVGLANFTLGRAELLP